MSQLQIAQTLKNIKEAQTAFKTLRTSTKTAFDDPSMGMNDKDSMIEEIFVQAEALVDTAVTAIESVEGGGMGMEQEIGEPQSVAPTDIGGINEEPDKKINMAMEDDDPTKHAMQKMAQEIEEQGKTIEDMKNKEAQMKLAQRYSELFPMAMRTAKFNDFMSHKGTSAVLEARLDEASVNLSKANAVKIAQQEDSLFNFDDLDSTNSNKVNPGSKI